MNFFRWHHGVARQLEPRAASSLSGSGNQIKQGNTDAKCLRTILCWAAAESGGLKPHFLLTRWLGSGQHQADDRQGATLSRYEIMQRCNSPNVRGGTRTKLQHFISETTDCRTTVRRQGQGNRAATLKHGVDLLQGPDTCCRNSAVLKWCCTFQTRPVEGSPPLYECASQSHADC